MAERNDVKLRLCKKCEQEIESTAKGIKAHADACKPSKTTITIVED